MFTVDLNDCQWLQCICIYTLLHRYLQILLNIINKVGMTHAITYGFMAINNPHSQAMPLDSSGSWTINLCLARLLLPVWLYWQLFVCHTNSGGLSWSFGSHGRPGGTHWKPVWISSYLQVQWRTCSEWERKSCMQSRWAVEWKGTNLRDRTRYSYTYVPRT